MLQPPDEILVSPFRHPALLRSLLHGDHVALGRWLVAVPLERIAAREVISTAITEMYFQWVRLRGPAVPLELLKIFELCVRAEAALDYLDRPSCEVGL